MYRNEILLLFSRNYEDALKIMQKSTTPPPRAVAYHDEVSVYRGGEVSVYRGDEHEPSSTHFNTCKLLTM